VFKNICHQNHFWFLNVEIFDGRWCYDTNSAPSYQILRKSVKLFRKTYSEVLISNLFFVLAFLSQSVGVTTSHQCYGSCTGCQSVSALCSRSRGSYISRSLEGLPCTSHTTVAFCRTLVIAHCGPTPMTCGSCSCREHITNSVIVVSRPLVLDCETTFHPDYGGRDLPLTPSDNLWNLIYLATEAPSDSVEFIGAIEISLSIYPTLCYTEISVSPKLDARHIAHFGFFEAGWAKFG